MKTMSLLYDRDGLKTEKNLEALEPGKSQLVLGFGSRELVGDAWLFAGLRQKFPVAEIVLCSTAGEIYGDEVLDDSVSVTAIEFAGTLVKSASIGIDGFETSYQAGAALVQRMDQEDLRYMLVISDGGKVNGSELVRGIESQVQHKIPVTGGLAGDGARFQSTLVGLNAQPEPGRIVVIGLYGNAIRIGHGSLGGWEMFGLEKTITRSTANELFEIDNINALELYKQYLGKYAEELPGSALLFPLSIKLPGAAEPIVRTILSINPEASSMIFAGDVPEGARVRFMKANFDKLIDAAASAASIALTPLKTQSPKFAMLISCVGRKLILGNRVDEEVEAVKETFPEGTHLSGFYSYGEISPLQAGTKCELHNQTMTITTFSEM